MKWIPLLFIVSQAVAYTLVLPDAQTQTHTDIQMVYVGGKLEGRVKADAFLPTLLQPGDVLLYDGPVGTTTVNRPADPSWSFLGVGAGQPLYYWPQSQISKRLYLGFASDGGLVPTGTFASYFESDSRVNGTARWLEISLVDVQFTPAPGETDPGYFSLWQTGGTSGTTVWMSSFQNGIDASDATWLIEGGHAHYNWGFTAQGLYEITFRFSGLLASTGLPISSEPITYYFGVEFQPTAVPEPNVTALLAVGALFAGLRRPTLSRNKTQLTT